GFRRELAAVVGRARLHHDGLALRRARDRQRTLDLEELARMVERVPSRRVVEAALRLVEQKGVVVPAVPQAAHDVDEFASTAVALMLGQVLLAAEILRLAGIGGGHQIPAGASPADEIERSETAGD